MIRVQQVMHLDELVESRLCHVNVDGTGIVMVKVYGTPHALVDKCPNDASLLSDGRLEAGVLYCPSGSCGFHLTDGAPASGSGPAAEVLSTRLTHDNIIEVELVGD